MNKSLMTLMLAGVLAGCNLNAPEETPAPPDAAALTVVDQAAAQIVVTATPPPEPTIPPTPEVPPEQILLLAERQLLNGYNQDAVLTYQAVLRQTSAPSEAVAAALYGIGRGALSEGQFQVAADSLRQLIDQHGSDSRAAQGRFMRGEAYLGLSQWQAAIDDFQAYMQMRPGMLDSYALERIGDAQVALGQTDSALASYQQAADASRGLVPSLALRERVAQVLLSAGRTAEAVAQYDAILAVAQNAPYRADIAMRAARAVFDSGDFANGIGRMDGITKTYPTAPQAHEAMQTLLRNNQPVDDYLQGRIRFAYGDYPGAVEALNRWAASRSSVGEIPAEYHLLLGQAYRAIDNTEAAVTAFQTIIDTFPTDPLFGAALLEQGRTRFLANDIPGAIGRYMTIAQNYGYLPEAPEALWRAGYLYSTNDQPDAARAVFDQLAEAYPNTQQTIDGLFLAATNAYRVNQLDVAERYYALLGTNATGENRSAAYFWLGRLALQRGDQTSAAQAFGQAAAAAPDTFFAARAADIVAGRNAFSPPAQYRFTFDDAADITAAEAWLRTTFSITQEGSLWQLSPELAADPRLVRGTELWALAQPDEAGAEFNDLVTSNESNPLASYQLAIYLRGIGAYYYSILASSYIIRAANVGTLDAPPFIARMRYPAYYLDVVQDAAKQYQFDPLLMFSLIRHESLFNRYATAAAGEIGLTQVIPGTAQYIADSLQWSDYQHADLFSPYAGIAFGAFYLNEQLDRFDQNATAALAGYNAGPGRAIEWLEVSGGDPDQFMTAISISSTRTYVERIYSYHAIYRALYGAS